MCIRSQLFQNEYEGNVGTPPHAKKFRKTTAQEVGLKQIHPGMQGDKQVIPENHSYGRKVEKNEGVEHVIKAQNMNGFADRSNDVLEGKYASSIREPLGGGYKRGYNWPNAAENGSIAFGVATTGLDNAKELLYTKGGSLEEKPDVTKMYIKTHGNYGPGEQRAREYDW